MKRIQVVLNDDQHAQLNDYMKNRFIMSESAAARILIMEGLKKETMEERP